MATAVENALMLGLASDYVLLFARSPKKSGHTLYAHIVTFGCTARENDFLWIGSNQARDMLSCLFCSLLTFPSIRVRSGMRISVKTSEEREHGVEDSGIDRSCGLRVQINRSRALVHDGGLLEDARSRAHHCVRSHLGSWHLHLRREISALLDEFFLVCLDGGLDVCNLSLGRLRFGDIVAALNETRSSDGCGSGDYA